MAIKPPSICTIPGCPRPAYKHGRCDVHAAELRKTLESARRSPSQRGYGSTWRQIRRAFLQKHPTCMDPFHVHRMLPLVKATEVDHKIPKAKGGTDYEDNLQALCKSCHSRKTAIEDGRWR